MHHTIPLMNAYSHFIPSILLACCACFLLVVLSRKRFLKSKNKHVSWPIKKKSMYLQHFSSKNCALATFHKRLVSRAKDETEASSMPCRGAPDAKSTSPPGAPGARSTSTHAHRGQPWRPAHTTSA